MVLRQQLEAEEPGKRLKQMVFEITENLLERLIKGLNQNQPMFIEPTYHLK